MQPVQNIQSSVASLPGLEASVHTSNTSPLKTSTNPGFSGPKRFSELQQQVLLVLVGAVWMGLSLASLTFAMLSAEPSSGGGAAKAAPSEIAKPASYTPPANPSAVRAVKV